MVFFMKQNFVLSFLVLTFLFLAGCNKPSNQAQQQEIQEKIVEKNIEQQEPPKEFTPLPLSYGYEDLDSFVGSKIVIEGQLTGEGFSHEAFFHPPYAEMAHFNLNSAYHFSQTMPHIVIYFKKSTSLDHLYIQFLDKNALVFGTLGKVEGGLRNPDKAKVKNRKAHTEYFLDIEKIELVE